MRVIGTAGHVDHGKSALIEALTGTHPDRLREEQERGLTIVLGFAWLNLPNGEEIGIVDVPGHRDFIENMLSGIGAIDAALFVVAADEGVMPQTREHLAILDLLQIKGGVVALTKIDLIEDPDWLELVEADVREVLSGTVLDSVPFVRVSARTGAGIPELLEILESTLTEKPRRPDLGRPRLSVDRAFTVAGFGTVVTGTLTDGSLNVGDEVSVLPQGLPGRVRGLQTHKRVNQAAVPGSRTAVNISGIDLDQVHRGDVIVRPKDYQPTRRMDVRFRLLAEATQPVKHNTEMKLFLGSAEVMARLRLIGTDVLIPGEEGWLQLEFAEPIVAVRGDRYILRRPSPPETVGGGSVVDPHPKGRHKRFDDEVLERFDALAEGTPAEIFLQALLPLGAAPFKDVVSAASLDQTVVEDAYEELSANGQVIALSSNPLIQPTSLIASRGYWNKIGVEVGIELENYHHSFPFRHGIPREELKSRLGISAKLFDALTKSLVSEEKIEEKSLREKLPGVSAIPVVKLPLHTVAFLDENKKAVEKLLGMFKQNPFSPPSIKESIAEVGEEIYSALVDLGELIPVSGEVVFRLDDYQDMVASVRHILDAEGTISVAQVRDRFNTSRRYVLAFMEHLDAIGITVRVGDVRRLKS
ncbi:MAG: selenocysteine-specific translation elongation factor [Anaerolineales bacterium]|nr:selenocysteine-specific translation elongation factor [Chloroflexota bacterium]MBL6983742.1 selenocysteine-specific translation elongation factor [Anaerolineales bacterium]